MKIARAIDKLSLPSRNSDWRRWTFDLIFSHEIREVLGPSDADDRITTQERNNTSSSLAISRIFDRAKLKCDPSSLNDSILF